MRTILLRTSTLHAVLFVALFMAGACKKTNNDNLGNGSGYYMKFKLNGMQMEYTGQVECNFNKVSGSTHVASFAGLKVALNAGSNAMTLALGTADDNKTGVTYTNYTTTASGTEKAKALNIGYMDETGVTYLSWPDEFAAALPVGTKTEAQMKVIEATSAALKGTFSGIVYNADYSKELIVTEGEFYLRRID